MYKNCKELNEQKIHELVTEIEGLSEKSTNLEKAMKSKLNEK